MSDIKLFQYSADQVVELLGKPAGVERWLQSLIESNMKAFLGVHFLVSEYSTGAKHGGRIDSLGLDENGCPVIIEYKRHSSETIINQGLHYLNWLDDRKAEFRLLVMDKLGGKVANDIEWEGKRLLCIVADFTEYDGSILLNTHRDVELRRYELFGDAFLLFDLFNSSGAAKKRVEKFSGKQTKVVVSTRSTALTTRQFEQVDIGDSDISREKKIIALCIEYCSNKDVALSYKVKKELLESGLIPRRYLQMRTASLSSFAKHRYGSARALDTALKNLKENSQIQEVDDQEILKQYGVHGKFYRLR
jgi:hypothetical protein